MYYHTLEDKRYLQKHAGHLDFSPGFHFARSTHGKDDVPKPCPKSMEGLRQSGAAGRTHVPADITDKRTADAICEYLNANPEPANPRLTQAVLERALTALGYGTLEEYLAPVKATRIAPEVTNPFKPSGDPFNFNRYIRESRGLFAIGYAGVNIAKLPSHAHAVEALRYLRTVRAGGLDNPKSLLTTHMATWQPLEDLA